MDSKHNIKPFKIPRGLEALLKTCSEVYPDQKNPLQVTTILKYWLGGSEPIDYINLYNNTGRPELNIPPHWHYVTFGLSDLHGDGRVHLNDNSLSKDRSGMGFELTFRLKKTIDEIDRNETKPPSWPANLLQSIAKYIFQTGNKLYVGDNIPWNKSLSGKPSQICHMLIAEDPVMKQTETPFGFVDFLQIIGVTDEELKQAERWNGRGVMNMLQMDSLSGGEWLVTDMNRTKSVFELFPETVHQLKLNLEREGSDLAGVDSVFKFKEIDNTENLTSFNPIDDISDELSSTSIEVKKENLESKINNSIECPINSPFPLPRAMYLSGVEIIFAPYVAKYLHLAINDRIRHGRHFTFKNTNMAITFLHEQVSGSNCTLNNPFVVVGYWLQVLIPNNLINDMVETFKTIQNKDDFDANALPIIYEWPYYKLRIVIDKVDFQQHE